MLTSIDVDLLITNLLLLCRLVKLLLFKGAKNVKIEKICQMPEYINITSSDLVYYNTSLHQASCFPLHTSVAKFNFLKCFPNGKFVQSQTFLTFQVCVDSLILEYEF